MAYAGRVGCPSQLVTAADRCYSDVINIWFMPNQQKQESGRLIRRDLQPLKNTKPAARPPSDTADFSALNRSGRSTI